jgi:hypothetical protein
MKLIIINKANCRLIISAFLVISLFCFQATVYAQDSTAAATVIAGPAKVKPVKNTFESVWIIDNQTVLVPVKKTFEMDIQHRFGTVNNGYEDFWGFFAPSNIRIGFSYVPVNKLNVG